MELEWTNTREVLNELSNLLLCSICGKMVQKPTVLGGCEHFYCRQCITDYLIGENCPKCQMPSHARDVMPNRNLNVCVTLVKQLQQLLTDERPREDKENEVEVGITVSIPQKRGRSTGDNKVKDAASLPQSTGRSTSDNKVKDTENLPQRRGRSTGDNEVKDTSSASHRRGRSTGDNKVKDTVSAPQQRERSRSNVSSTDDSNVKDDESKNCINRRVGKKGRAKKLSGRMKEASGSTVSARDEEQKVKNGESREVIRVSEKQKTLKIIEVDSTPRLVTAFKGQKSKSSPSNVQNQPWLSPSTPVSTRSSRSGRLTSPALSPAANLLGKRNHKGETPLHQASIKGDVSGVKSLLDQGAPINVKDNAGWTPLHEASNHGHLEIVELLLTRGAMIDIPGLDNMTPLHDAVENQRIECVKLLVSRGASVNARNIHGKTPFDLAQTKALKGALQTRVLEDCVDKSLSQNSSLSLQIHQVVILSTGLTREQKITVQRCASIMHGTVVQDFSNQVTHVVTSVNQDGQCPRTMKFLQAVLTGKWILTFDWVSTCLEYESRVSEEPFEVPGSSMAPNSQAPAKSRHNVDLQLPRLFDGCNIFFSGDFNYPTPDKLELMELVKLGGATIVSREPKLELIDPNGTTVPYHAKTGTALSSCGYFAVYDSSTKTSCGLVGRSLCKVKASWIMDCIALFELLIPE